MAKRIAGFQPNWQPTTERDKVLCREILRIFDATEIAVTARTVSYDIRSAGIFELFHPEMWEAQQIRWAKKGVQPTELMIGSWWRNRHEYDKDDTRTLINNLRRAGKIPERLIRADYHTVDWAYLYDGPDHYRDTTLRRAGEIDVDLQKGQRVRIELWTESAGTLGVLEDVAKDYGITVCSSGGYDTMALRMEKRYEWKEWLHDGACERVHVIHAGDYNEDGLSIFDALVGDMTGWQPIKGKIYDPINWADGGESLLGPWYENRVTFERFALTDDQINEYGLTRLKAKGNRGYGLDCAVELEALKPYQLKLMLIDRIESILDLDKIEAMKEYRDELRDTLHDGLSDYWRGDLTDEVEKIDCPWDRWDEVQPTESDGGDA